MAKKFFKWLAPPREKLTSNRSMKFLGNLLHEESLWHLNRHSASTAVFVGVFMAFMPIPSQMLAAALTALWVRCNLPLAVVLVWISNPVTMPPIFYGCYKLGNFLLGGETEDFHFELSWVWLTDGLIQIWQPLLLGCFVSGVFFGSLSYGITRLMWRQSVARRWRIRRELRAKRLSEKRDV
ncbi:MAG: DUF2062 domain-containing protein [Pseudomonadales bacterium]